MADPQDESAREALRAELHVDPFIVQGDQVAIDSLIDKIWTTQSGIDEDRRIMVLIDESMCSGQVTEVTLRAHWRTYFESLACMLHANLTYYPGQDSQMTVVGLNCQHQFDILVLQEPDFNLMKKTGTSQLVLSSPRWPIKRILFVIEGNRGDDCAAEWVLEFARSSRASVTVLTIVPPLPAMYFGLMSMNQGLPEILKADTPLGRQLRKISHQLQEYDIDGNLRLREGSASIQLRLELIEQDYDLIISSADGRGKWKNWLERKILAPLLQWDECPVLLATPQV
jgi:nucleotide-binding universal stress UspA family protein